tara:strand:+ start:1177 stop:1290 length:114 start_codon:yes stop_codon:yes gene_type:complete
MVTNILNALREKDLDGMLKNVVKDSLGEKKREAKDEI